MKFIYTHGSVADIFAQSFREILRRSFNVSIEIFLYTQKLLLRKQIQIIIFSSRMFKSLGSYSIFVYPQDWLFVNFSFKKYSLTISWWKSVDLKILCSMCQYKQLVEFLKIFISSYLQDPQQDTILNKAKLQRMK